MAAPSQTSYNSSTGNGVTTVFPYTFKILQDSDLQVLVDGVEQTLTTHYTVSGAGVDAGGNVTFVTAPANGATVVRRRDMAIARTGTDYQYQGDIPSAVLNSDQDAPILMLQQLQEQINRALRLPAGDTAAEFDAADDRADLLPMFNTTTGALELSDFTATQLRDMIANGYGSGSLGVSGFIATLLDDANATAARATLGSTTVGDALFVIASAAAARALLSAAASGANGDITSLTGLTTAISGTSLGDKIQPITASVAANALTITLNPTTLDFRSATPSSGAVNTRSVSAAISVVVPSTATLGTVSGISVLHRLAVLAIDATSLGGSVELAVANISQGMWLDETDLITTTTISASANSASVAYSTTGRSSVPFRIVGFVDIAEATAGTWASAPTIIQGAGGLALPFIPGKYVSQSLSGAAVDFTGIPSWVNSIDIVFTNATTGTGNPIVQIGTAAALVTSGYPSNTSVRSAATNAVLSGSSTSGFLMYTSAASDVLNMMMSLRRVAGNTWAMTAQGLGSGWAIISGGYLSLAGPLGQIRLINTSGNWGGGSASILMR